MSATDSRLYRADALEPALTYDDVVMLVDAGGLNQKYESPFFGIQGVRPITGLGPKGLFVIWTQGAMPAGYGSLPSGAPTGSIAAAASVTYPNPAPLNLGSYQLVQVRFNMEVLALTGAVTLHDLDLQMLVGSVGDFGLPAISPGFMNMIDQMQSPADQTVDPAQNANKALPAAFPQQNPWDAANLTETYWFENNPPTFKVTNNGGAAITGGTIGLRIKGFRYFLVPLKPDNSWASRWIAGAWRRAPAHQQIVTIPTVPPTGTQSF